MAQPVMRAHPHRATLEGNRQPLPQLPLLPQFNDGLLFFLFLFILSCTPPARSETLLDPTLPPASLGLGSENPALGRENQLVLQSVLISPTRRVAIINGQTIQLKEYVEEWKLEKINEGEVTLRKGNQVQVVKLFPEINMRMSNSSPAANNK